MNAFQEYASGRVIRDGMAGARLDRLPLRLRMLWYCAFPRVACRVFHWRFRLWAALPGDVFENFQLDEVYVVHRVRRDDIEATAISAQLLRMSEYAMRLVTPLGVVDAYAKRPPFDEFCSESTLAWQPVTGYRAGLARLLAHD